MLKTLNEYLAEGDYSAFARFLQTSQIHQISGDDEYDFFVNAPEHWAEALVSAVAPSRRAEKAIVKYQPQGVLDLLVSLWKPYPRTILWAFKEGSPEDALKVVNALRDKPAEEAEVALVKRGELELFKLWIEKFGELDEEAEKLLNEDPQLTALKSYYIDQMSCFC